MPGQDGEHRVTKRRLGFHLDDQVYRMGVPRLRLGKRFYRLSWWIVPAAAVAAVVVFGTRLIVDTPAWQNFASANPCIAPDAATFDYPAWLRSLHWVNFLLMALLFRSGIQILADHPRLYLTLHSTPDKEWLRFRGPVPKDRVWTAVDDSVHLSPLLGLPGGRHSSGIARHWHFLTVPTWILVGAAFITMLFVTSQWQRLVPTSFEIIPRAANCAVTYASFHLAPGEELDRSYNALQQLAYFFVVFIAAPSSILTGIAMSPAIGHRFAWYERLFGNRQIARSIHFLLWCFYAFFVIVHVSLVVITGFARNMNHITLGTNDTTWWGVVIGAFILTCVFVILVLAHWFSWTSPRRLQHTYQRVARRMNGLLFDRMVPRRHFAKEEISPYMWPNGLPPKTDEYDQHQKEGFRDYRLRVFGEVEEAREFSLDDLKAMGKHEQITEHDCVQGWSAIAEWGGVRLSDVLGAVRPRAGARFAIFHAFDVPEPGKPYYDAHDLKQLWNPDSILAYEMNYEELPLLHGAPLRLRNESELGFKQVKWIKSIEIVRDYRGHFEGEGGFREDNEYQGRSAEI